MIHKADIFDLFPTPVYSSVFPRNFSKEEIEFAQSVETYNNIGNLTSVDRNILDQVIFQEIKTHLEQLIQQYVNVIINPVNDINIYITQSWINVSYSGQYHHKHNHPNSILSGLLYLNASEDKDRIYFYNDMYRQIRIDSKELNTWNSDAWWLKAGTGKIFIFPSHFSHAVAPVLEDTTRTARISLSFNTFLKGAIGNNELLFGLDL